MLRWARALWVASLVGAVVSGASGCAAPSGSDGELTAAESDAVTGAKAFGLGIDAPAAIASPHFAALQQGWKAPSGFSLTTARNVLYMDPGGGETFNDQVNKLQTWVDAVTQAGLTPLVAIAPAAKDGCGAGKTCVLLDDATYEYRFHQLLAWFPQVAAWGPVNEPDVLARFSVRPKGGPVAQVVRFFVDAASVLDDCRQGGGCQHVSLFAGEFAGVNEGYWHRYVGRMRAEVHAGRLAEFPRVWGLHPYGDTTTGNPHEVDAYVHFLRHVEDHMGYSPGTLRVWLTESGTLLEHDTITHPTCRDDGRAKKQFKGAEAVYRFTRRERVDRVYWWQFEQATQCWCGAWDSAMADWNDTPRPSFCALAKLPLSQCTGALHARDCGGPGRAGCTACP